MDPCRSNIGGGRDPCDPCGVDAYGGNFMGPGTRFRHVPTVFLLSLLANSRLERSRADDFMPNVPISSISCLPPSRVDPEVQGLEVIIDCPQPGSSRVTYMCVGNDCGGE